MQHFSNFFEMGRFSLKQKNRGNGSGDCDVEAVDITVYEYFVNHRNIKLTKSADLPCVNVGKSKRPTYYPLEVWRCSCHLNFITVPFYVPFG